MNQSLEQLRNEIDKIDENIHRLIMQRVDVVEKIAAIKGKSVSLRPGREAQIMRALIKRHKGAFPLPVLLRIWREMISAFTGMQNDFSMAVVVEEKGEETFNIGREYYGFHTPVLVYHSSGQVLRAVSEGKVTIGILPFPSDDEAEPWWPQLMARGENVPHVVGQLPFVRKQDNQPQALVIARILPEPSGEDKSLLALETSQEISRGLLRSKLTNIGFEVGEFSLALDTPNNGRLHLLALMGYIAEDDKRLKSLYEQMGPQILRASIIGSYAVSVKI